MKRFIVIGVLLLSTVVVASVLRGSQVSLFAVTFTTGPAWQADKSPGEQAGFAEHSANLSRLRREGKVVLGGRFGAFGLVLVTADNEAAARELFQADPTMQTGVFRAEFNRWQTFYGGTLGN